MTIRRLLFPLFLLAPAALLADEGMWTLDNPPNKLMQERYGFSADEAWLKHVQVACVRFGSGGSGAFVSEDGLVLTNHHIVVGTLQKLSTPDEDLVKNGFIAKTRKEERHCPGLELYQLQSFENVTGRVNKALEARDESTELHDAKRAVVTAITDEEKQRTGLFCEVKELYQGGEFWVCRYKTYSDIRMVMAPETSAGHFGGHPDNFTYPRFCFDYAFVRAYGEDGKPIKPQKWFSWSKNGTQEGELSFVAGHPGSTERAVTLAQLEHERDKRVPFMLERMKRKTAIIQEYQKRGAEEKRRGARARFGTDNYLKKLEGLQHGLGSEELFAKKAADEKALRKTVDAGPELKEAYGDAWDKIEEAYAKKEARWKRDSLVFTRGHRGGALISWAESLVALVEESRKPPSERLYGFADAQIEKIKTRLFAEAPSYPDLEAVLLELHLTELVEVLGKDDPMVKGLLKGLSPKEVAEQAASNTTLADPDVRKKLAGMTPQELRMSKDPMIQLAWVFDEHGREALEWNEKNIWMVSTVNGGRIAKAKFALHGKDTYPDATYSLRLTYGKAASYEEGSTIVPHKTVMGGLYARHDAFDGKEPFHLHQRILDARDEVDMTVPLNFVTTHDITGGNSGSPVFNKDLEIIGVIFDSNFTGIANDYVYTNKTARSVNVDSRGILESLTAIYGMDALVEELRTSRASASP